MNNIEIFNYSLSKKEEYIDKFYEKDFIVSKKTISDAQKLNIEINNFKNSTSESNKLDIVNNIIYILKNKNLNCTPFVTYWQIYDVSYSIYVNFDIEMKENFIYFILKEYIANRNDLYSIEDTQGYLQLRSDSGASRRSGGLGSSKYSELLTQLGYKEVFSYEDLLSVEKSYCQADKKGKHIFNEFLYEYNVSFDWKNNNHGKFPDILIKNKAIFYIVEHKHMKEGGGAQNKQMTEINTFINHSENGNISYVGFIDGIYFNKFTSKNKDHKTQLQIDELYNSLSNNNKNYIVNTAGFVLLLDY